MTKGEVDRDPAEPPRIRAGKDNRVPLYHQIYLILRSKILDGEFRPGDYLPGERDLERMFQVSRITAVRALNELAAAGLAVRERGRGTRVQFVERGIVSRGPASRGEDKDIHRGTTHEVFSALRRVDGARVTVFEYDYVEASPAVAEALDVAAGTSVQHAARVWRVGGKPFNFVITYVPVEVARHWTREDLERAPLGELMERHGIIVSLLRERVTATLADAALSERLEVSLGSPLLKIYRTAYDQDRRPVEYLIGYYPPDRYQYEAIMPRAGGSGREMPRGRE